VVPMDDAYDVCLILEGTYPYVAGGVSTWVHDLISSMPELRFTAICILASSKEKYTYKYTIPPNFVDPQVLYLHDYEVGLPLKMPGKTRKHLHEKIRAWHHKSLGHDFTGFADLVRLLQKQECGIDTHEMMYGRTPFNLLTELYTQYNSEASFLDYFWTYRFTHMPMLNILRRTPPLAKCYHTVSTGFAGLMGAYAHILYGRPLLLTEHGIYTKERKIEIAQAKWIHTEKDERLRIEKNLGAFQSIWVRTFEALSRLAYDNCHRILTLYEGNRQLEIEGGADPDRCEIIPNGIRLEKFAHLKPLAEDIEDIRSKEGPFSIGFVGRIVPIKDVKTFVRACKIVAQNIDSLKVYIIGPTEEDEDYAKECSELVEMLGLKDIIEFTGRVQVTEFYPRLDLVVLTSVSEAQPLVILEANCAGIPCVASDVGSCSELLHGRPGEDEALGPSGYITKPADPMDTAQGMLAVLLNPELRRAMSIAGRKRVERFYAEEDLNRRYEALYRECMALPSVEA